MKPEIKEKLISLLEGEFKDRQSRYVLGVPGYNGAPSKHCCLGVLCELAIREGVDVIKNTAATGKFEYNYHDNFPPEQVVAWAGLDINLADKLIDLNDLPTTTDFTPVVEYLKGLQ